MAKGTNWTDTTDKQLLLAVIHLTAPGTPKWDLVAAMMGEGYTAESVRQHFQKLKKTAGTGATTSGSDAAPATTTGPKTPAKKTAGKKAAGETTGKSSTKRKAGKAVDHEVDVDDEESPTKKVKEDPDALV